MTNNERAADGIMRNFGMLQMHLADFSDADMLVRPCPGANHSAWQIGHLLTAETNIINMISPGKMPPLPPDIAGKYNKDTAKLDDPKAFVSKDRLLEQFAKTRAATVAWAGSLAEAEMDNPGPAPLKDIAPTVGHVVTLVTTHTGMHIGQIQVIRRKLGKPVLF